MGLFGRKKEQHTQAVRSADTSKQEGKASSGKKLMIKILGEGCDKCDRLEANTQEAIRQLGVPASVDHITDFVQIAAYGVMSTPGFVINGKVISVGKVLKTKDIIALLKQHQE